MIFEAALGYSAAALSLLLAVFVMGREWRHLAYRGFAVGMIVLAVREVLGVWAAGSYGGESLFWHRCRLAAASGLPGFWLLFSLTFARATERRFLRRWKWALVAAFLLPAAIAIGGWDALVVRPLYAAPSWLVPLGSAGFWLHVALLLAAVAVLVNLESTLRASSGTVRWHIKFTVLGLGALFGVEIFVASQALLFSVVQTTLFPFGSGALVLAVAFVSFSMARRRLGRFDVYPSESFLFNSLTLLVVGIYLLAVSFVAELLGDMFDQAAAFVVLVALVALALLLLSTEVRHRVKTFLSRHLKRPAHDYRGLWNTFTRRTGSIVEIEPLCAAITKIAAETFGCAAATIWLVPEGEKRLVLGGSTALQAQDAHELLDEQEAARRWFEILKTELDEPLDLLGADATEDAREAARRMEARYSTALLSNDGRPIGFLTVNERVTGQRFTLEDVALLKTLAGQAAAAIQNRQLSKRVQQAREMETFQTLSTFFVHDLKNLASRLSLVLQNLPAHYDKPAFREDLLKTMEKSVAKIDTMTARLSSLTEGLTLQRSETDLNALVRESVAGLNGSAAALELDFQEVPSLRIDPEQIQKVVTNLVLNAQEASADGGRVVVRTSRENGWVLLSVADDGCGMSSDFVARSLFKPFQTTKKQGLGIGLFHTKTIVEAHGGRIEVDTEEGKGTVFRVLLPAESDARQ